MIFQENLSELENLGEKLYQLNEQFGGRYEKVADLVADLACSVATVNY